MKKEQKVFDAEEFILACAKLIGIALVLLAPVGWILNIIKIFQVESSVIDWGGVEVARVIGVFFAPLGALMGFL